MKAFFLFLVLSCTLLGADEQANPPTLIPDAVPTDSTSVVKEAIAQPVTEEKAATSPVAGPDVRGAVFPSGTQSMVPSVPGLNAPAVAVAPVEKKRAPAEADACRVSPMKVASLIIPSLTVDKISLTSGRPRRLMSYNLNLPCAATVTLTAQIDYELTYCWNEFIGASASRNCAGAGANGQVQVRNLTYSALGFAPKDRLVTDGFLNGILREASTKLFVNVSNSTDTFPGLTHSYHSRGVLPVTMVHASNLAPGDYQIALDVYPDGVGDGNVIEKLHPINVLIVPD